MSPRFFNGIQADVPDDWADLSTIILAPRRAAMNGKPSINLVIKRRPAQTPDVQAAVRSYLEFMRATFGVLESLQSKEMMAGNIRGTAVKFTSGLGEKRFTQTTFIYRIEGDEISATVTQVERDTTSAAAIERLLQSVRPAGGSLLAARSKAATPKGKSPKR